MNEQQQQKYEEYRIKVKEGTPLRQEERAEWVELQKLVATEQEIKDADEEIEEENKEQPISTVNLPKVGRGRQKGYSTRKN